MMMTGPQTSYDERLAANYIPYFVLEWEDAIASFKDGWIRDAFEAVYKDMGLKYFSPFPEGFGGIATKDRYAVTYEGAQGHGSRR
jgi:TRAP-type transport system periplasmic protein